MIMVKFNARKDYWQCGNAINALFQSNVLHIVIVRKISVKFTETALFGTD